MPNPFTLAVTLVALAVFVNFVWAIRRFFVAPENPQTGMRLISILGLMFMVVHLFCLWTGRQSALWVMAAIFMYVVALSLFWWSIRANRKKPLTLAYSHDRPQHLVQEGPYRHIRHPFYTAYTLAWIAGVLGSGQVFLILTVLLMFWLYYRAARMEENKFAASDLGDAYRDYQKRTGMFLPR